jgi:hypothetical protein
VGDGATFGLFKSARNCFILTSCKLSFVCSTFYKIDLGDLRATKHPEPLATPHKYDRCQLAAAVAGAVITSGEILRGHSKTYVRRKILS